MTTQGLCERGAQGAVGTGWGIQSRLGGQGRLPGEGVFEKGLKGRAIGFESTGEGAGRGAACAKAQGHEQWAAQEGLCAPLRGLGA